MTWTFFGRRGLKTLAESNITSMSNIMKIKCNGDSSGKLSVLEAVNSLKNGNIIATPTDTVYGLAAFVQNQTAIEKLYTIKGRNLKNPIAVCVAEVYDIEKWALVTVSNEVLTSLLPGPVTLVFERNANLNPLFNPHTNLVGVRIPDHDFIRNVCRISDTPIALTSANLSGTPSCLSVEEFSCIHRDLDKVFDGGTIGGSEASRLGSTVVDLSRKGSFNILRDGCAKNQVIQILKDKHGLISSND